MNIAHLPAIILEFVFVLGIMVLVHEFGHFAAAKLCGVRVEVFSIGFGPRLFGVKYGDTDYRIAALPLGGYVKMAGEYGGSAVNAAPDEFPAKPRWQRMIIGVAGPLANFILAFILMAALSHYHHEVDKYLSGPAVVDYVPANTPAASLGMGSGDTILSFNGKANPTWEKISVECALHMHQSLPITFSHQGQVQTGMLDLASAHMDNPSDPLSLFTALGFQPREQDAPIKVVTVSSDTPAFRAGLQSGDELIRVDAYSPHSVQAMQAYLRDRGGAPVTLLVRRNAQMLNLSATPEKLAACGGKNYCFGFQPAATPVTVEKLPWGAALGEAYESNVDDSTMVVRVLKGMFTRQVSAKQLMGPVGIAQQIDIATQLGPWTLVRFMATISIQLGAFNLLPFPPLDGAMIVFLMVESLMQRDVNEALKERIYQVAFVCLIVFACFVFFNDITRLRGH
ncbi:regulator of sigma E protease [Bryocella elongata]|uniref:Zinc metalloprotease n=1 Tax=Bryocella elongata TaxID=863522 RepID=A0A1H6AZ26_9BACT|nr:RIP metalloprotease RseP [Bryocella elongata]SEG53287.1 regulator of sigma E protease [Bryocella elongata]